MSTGTPSFFLPFLPNSGDRGDRRNGDLFLSFVPDGTRNFVVEGRNCTGKRHHAHVGARRRPASAAALPVMLSSLARLWQIERKWSSLQSEWHQGVYDHGPGHSNWTICSLLSWFCSNKFPHFYRASHNKSKMPKGDWARYEAGGAVFRSQYKKSCVLCTEIRNQRHLRVRSLTPSFSISQNANSYHPRDKG